MYAVSQAPPAAGQPAQPSLPDDEELRSAIERLLWLTQEAELAREKWKSGPLASSIIVHTVVEQDVPHEGAAPAPVAATTGPPPLRATSEPSTKRDRSEAGRARAFQDVTNRNKVATVKATQPRSQSPKAAMPHPSASPTTDPDPVTWRAFYKQATAEAPDHRIGRRLYAQGLLLQQLRESWAAEERRRMEQRGHAREGCTFTPQISGLARASTRPSGVTGIATERKADAPAAEPECTFQPRLNPQSICLISAKAALDEEKGIAPHERLYLENAEREKRRRQRKEQLEEANAPRPHPEECVKGKAVPPSVEALDRLVYSRQAAEAAMEKLRVNLHKVQEQTLFKPHVLTRERPPRTSRSPDEDFFGKLYSQGLTAMQEKEQLLEVHEKELREAANVGRYVNRASALMVQKLRHSCVQGLFETLDVHHCGSFGLEDVRQLLVQTSAATATAPQMVMVGRKELPLQALLIELLPLLEASGHVQFDAVTFSNVFAAMPHTGPSPYLMPGKRRKSGGGSPGEDHEAVPRQRPSEADPWPAATAADAAQPQAGGKPPQSKRAHQPRVAELHRERQEWAEKVARLQAERQAAELRQCTFQPNVGRRKAKAAPRPPAGMLGSPEHTTSRQDGNAPAVPCHVEQVHRPRGTGRHAESAARRLSPAGTDRMGDTTLAGLQKSPKRDVPPQRFSTNDSDTFHLSEDEDGDESADDALPRPFSPLLGDAGGEVSVPQHQPSAKSHAPLYPAPPAVTEAALHAPAATRCFDHCALEAAAEHTPPLPPCCGLPPRARNRHRRRRTAEMALVLEASSSDPPHLDPDADWDIGQFGTQLMQRQLSHSTALLDQLCAALTH
eukprot:GGOE01018765.1.p1 GENE.GGOE01018765.1~~GGOE01018765.1.p1  ORF type:complete len:986 (+),score=251.23 GGOE01018765.1:424-2958(+)